MSTDKATPRPNKHLTAEQWDAVRELVKAAQDVADTHAAANDFPPRGSQLALKAAVESLRAALTKVKGE